MTSISDLWLNMIISEKRSAKERLELTDTAKGNVINGFLPVFDNFERALGTETQDAVYKQGVEMIFNQFSDA